VLLNHRQFFQCCHSRSWRTRLLKKSEGFNRLNGVFPALPLLFGFQQAFEGFVWWSLCTNDPELLRTSAIISLYIYFVVVIAPQPEASFMV